MDKIIKVLHLEDKDDDAVVLAYLLRKQGLRCAIKTVQTGEEFVREVEHGVYDLIVSDVTLPGYDGIAALQQAIIHRPRTPFIFVTGSLSDEMRAELVTRGAADCLSKSNLSGLATAIVGVLERAKRKPALPAVR